MKFLNFLAALSLVLFVGCGGGSGDQQTEEAADSADQPSAQGEMDKSADDVRTIDIIGIDQMQFVVKEDSEGISVGEPTGEDGMLKLESITAKPGEKIRIKLTTKSQMPAMAMAHNWLLLKLDADLKAFATAAAKARDNDYVPADMTDQIIAQTGLTAGGETSEVTFTVPEKVGEYDFLCTFTGHFIAGMKGTFNVEE